MEILAVKDLSFTYPGSETPALEGVSVAVQEGEFVTICGKSGCGKSTLLRHMKPALTPHGKRSGQVIFMGQELEAVPPRTTAARVGFVMQSPEEQIVTDKVWHELAFGLESIGMESGAIRLRVAEMADFFGIAALFHRDTATLSGGQKQLVNLASVMAMQPSLLILDEPTSQLDPIGAGEFLACLKKINTQLGTAVIISEHRLEELTEMSDRVVVMEGGRIVHNIPTASLSAKARELPQSVHYLLPTAMRLYLGLGSTLPCPVTIKEGRGWLSQLMQKSVSQAETLSPEPPNSALQRETPTASTDVAISLKEVFFRHTKHGEDIISDFSLDITAGTVHAVMGGNGVGKTTLLSLIAGLNTPYRGKTNILGRDINSYKGTSLYEGCMGVLPQNPKAMFVKGTVEDELADMLRNAKLTENEKQEKVVAAAKGVEISHLLSRHPYDLSGGEQQRAALAKVLMLSPKILLLDEPTKGIDGMFKEKLGQILKGLADEGRTIVMVSHDVEFCAKYAHMCTLMFDGLAIATAAPSDFFGGNSFYTTGANKIARQIFPKAVTEKEVMELCRINLTEYKG